MQGSPRTTAEQPEELPIHTQVENSDFQEQSFQKNNLKMKHLTLWYITLEVVRKVWRESVIITKKTR